eukprot:c24756_g2_i1 orf=1022-4507(+)
MASSPSSISGRRNRPGCMGGISHLFDFNQALAGKKLLTDKKYGAGLEPVRNISKDNVEQSKSKTTSRGEIQFGKSASVSRRSMEVPMKALIAEEISQELSRETEQKNRAPSVVARLMGLDALPGDRKSEQSAQRGELENLVQKVSSDRLQHGKLLGHNFSGGSKSSGPPTRSVSDLSSSRRSNWEEHPPTFESLSSQSHSHEQNPREVFDPWKSWKSEDHARMQALDDMDLQLAAKQMLIKKKLSEAKLGLLSKHSGPQEKLYESKEFMDAIDFLQANKDFFARFLEEPDSLFAKHLRSKEENLVPGNMPELIKHTKRRANRAVENGVRAQNWGKEPPDLKKCQYKGSERDFQVDEKTSAGGSFLQPFSVKAHQKHPKSVEYNMNSTGECHQAPTRIVVLKPGPGKVRNLMSLSQNSPRSPREFFDAMEVIKENSMDVLQELKDKLQQEDARGVSRKARPGVNEHSKLSRDPREIAREIARQVRENVTRDLRANSKSTTSEGSFGRKTQLTKMAEENSSINASSHAVPGRDYVDESISKFSGQDPIYDRKALHRSKEKPRRSLDQLHVERCDVWSPEPQNAASGRSSSYGDLGQPLPDQGSFGVHGLNATHLSQSHPTIAAHADIDTDSCTYSLCESETDAYARSEGRPGDAVCITLLRSRSVPTSSSSLHSSQEVFRKEDQGMLENGLFVAGAAKVVDTNRSSDATIRQAEPLKRSIFARKGSGLKGSFSKSKKQVKQVDEIPLPSQEPPMQKSLVDACSVNEKVQHQIDDTGPVLDSDSSVSSLDNFLTLEAALMAENLDGAKVPDSVESFATDGNIITEKLEVSQNEERKVCQYVDIEEVSEVSLRSPLESPMKLTSLTDSEPSIAEPEAGKEPSEQPSPVSVLDAPFHEEPASPMDFTEISSGLQELRIRLQLLKFVDQEAVSIQEEYQEEDGDFTDDNRSATNHSHPSAPNFKIAGPDCSSNQMENLDSLIDGITCPQEMEPELMYVKNLLVTSGFTIDCTTILTRWHAPSQPLAWYVFERVENRYIDSENNNAVYEDEGIRMDSHTRHLLFDSVNEVLLTVLGPHVNSRTWWKSPQKSITLEMPSGKDLVRQVWAGVCKLSHSLSKAQDTLGSLVAEDLASKDRWQDFTYEFEVIVLEVERAIFNDLIQEILMMY